MQPRIIANADDTAVAQWLHERLARALAASEGDVALCLPGGSTPFPILAALTASESGKALDFSRITVWPGDDRIVPESHAASNTGKLRGLFEPLGARVNALALGQTPPHFALTWLGMGGDGHIASLFPNTNPDPQDGALIRQLTPDPLPPEAPFDRMTLTIPALINADEILFVIRGADKQAVFVAGAEGAHDLPVARLLAAANVPVTCFS